MKYIEQKGTTYDAMLKNKNITVRYISFKKQLGHKFSHL